jgi:hypothetical protein
MNVRISILCVLVLVGILGRPAAAGYGSHVGALEQHIRDHLNERMYNSCKTVVLTRKSEGVYRGYAQFINGTRSNLIVTVSDGNIEYAFVQPEPASAGPDAAGSQNAAELWRTIDEFEALAQQQQAEIARLQELCRRAGIDPQPAGAELGSAETAPATDADAASAQDTCLPAGSDQVAAFTTRMYGEIRKDMTHREVATLLGAPGDRLSSSYFEGAANEVYVWANPDDSHLCVIFQDGKVLLKTQAGLPGVAPAPERLTDPNEAIEIERLGDWQLALSVNGQIRLLGVSLGQWLEALYRILNEKASHRPVQVGIVEERDQIVVTLTHKDSQDVTQETSFYLVFSQDRASPEATNAKAVLIPSRMRINDRENTDPDETWRVMATLAELPVESGKSL